MPFMKKITKAIVFGMTLSMALGSVNVFAANPLENSKTPAEESNWERTTSSQEVIDYCKLVAENSGGRIRLEYVGITAQGRLIPMLVMGEKAPASAADVSADKAIVFVNCNIHSGEVEGKESMLIFAREVALGKHDDLLKDLVILLTPNLSADGNDDLGKHRNSTQFTPLLVGTRPQGEGLNVNRDMTKLDTAEGRAVVRVMNEWDPVLFIDAHATNGSFMRHEITYNWGLHPNTDADLLEYNRGAFSELALGPKSYLFSKGKEAVPYGNFGTNYSGIVAEGWQTFEDYPRYTTNYAGLRNRLAILLEVYSYDPFKKRVDTQYECIYGTLLAAQQEKTKIKELVAQADARALERAEGIDPKTDFVALNSKLAILTEVNGGKIDVKSYAVDAEGKVPGTKLKNDDGDFYAVELGEEAVHTIDNYSKFEPTGTETMGAYYLVEADGVSGIELLTRHGIEVSRLTKDLTLRGTDFEWYDAATLNKRDTAYEGHLMNRITGEWKEAAKETVFPAGTYVISTAQHLGSFAALMLEPASVDGATSWNFFDKALTAKEGTVRAGFRSNTTDAENVAIPIFKVADPASITKDVLTAETAFDGLAYTDVAYTDWSYRYVEYMTNRGFVTSQTPTAFKPDEQLTRAEFVEILARMSNETLPEAYEGAFTDLAAGTFTEKAVAWAVNAGIISGTTDTTFSPDAKISREQIAAIIARYAAYKKITLPVLNEEAASTDEAAVSDFAKEAVTAMQKANIIGGYTDGAFYPHKETTRAEACKMLTLVDKI